MTHTHFSVSSGVGFLALFGVAVQTGVIMLEYINQLRARGAFDPGRSHGRLGAAPAPHHDDHAGGQRRPAAGGAFARHRLGFPAPFAIVIVGGLVAALVLGVFLLPTLYVWFARPSDHLSG